ncbi:nitronate monooxygenase [Aldersonia sp. NBC_00410]|uniref:nitronate monooxygenase n=1 Tax=Aldersonia sp. NBC_00410 TaxID=2975954 RepID=UPI002258113C|nr:nitronate monooxygenase [Aldersonia sp. NBC_00410]MCX5042383.1 nitronate monooxygenase [Aldersonia sp. NBC_00410]
MKRFDLRSLTVPVIAAPMAGGPSTPALVAAATNAGGLGIIAGGLLIAEALASTFETTAALTSGPFGVNLFVPQPSVCTQRELAEYARTLEPEAQRYGVELGAVQYNDKQWSAQLAMALDVRPDLLSFTFGVPSAEECSQLHGAGISTLATVTTPSEAAMAEAHGVDAIVVQGPSAGGHRSTFNPAHQPPSELLPALLHAVRARVDMPVVAAGGIATAEDVADSLASGAIATQVGTALLLADEAGTHPAHRAALQDEGFTETVVTRSFTGRYARGLRNRFIDDHDSAAPLGFPEVAHITGPLQTAAAHRGDPHGMALWAGTAFRQARAASVAEIMHALL